MTVLTVMTIANTSKHLLCGRHYTLHVFTHLISLFPNEETTLRSPHYSVAEPGYEPVWSSSKAHTFFFFF